MPGILSVDPQANSGYVSPECSQSPPVPLEGEPSVADPCHVIAPLVDLEKTEEARLIRFDRQGDQYVLSKKNSEANIAWLQSFPERPDIPKFIEAKKRKVEALKMPESTAMEDSSPGQVFLDLDLSSGFLFSENEAGFIDTAGLLGAELGFQYFPSWKGWGGGLAFQYLYDYSDAHRALVTPSAAYFDSPVRVLVGPSLGLTGTSRPDADGSEFGALVGLRGAIDLVHRFDKDGDDVRLGMDQLGIDFGFSYQTAGAKSGPQGSLLLNINPIGLLAGIGDALGEGLMGGMASNDFRTTF